MDGKAKSSPPSLATPDFSIETSLYAASPQDLFQWGGQTEQPQVIGIDEAGRGPWAGPVIAGAAWVNPACLDLLPQGIDDSKKLTASRRRHLFDQLSALGEKGEVLRFATAAISPPEIDKAGILKATFAAMEAAVIKLAAGYTNLALIVDGNLAPPFPQLPRDGHLSVLPLVKGDGRSLSIAIAAIAAKETRDAEMRRLDALFPGYGWANNMGYGTAAHAEALAKQGPTPQHRFSFRPVASAAEAHGTTR